MIPSTVARVSRPTSEEANEEIRQQTSRRLAQYYSASQADIEQRLRELDDEWDVDRALQANAATISLLGLGLGTFASRKFYALPAVVAGFLLQHAVQGFCPPLPLLRRLGYRTAHEIEQERYALKALRGDFDPLASADSAPGGNPRTQRLQAALDAVAR